MTRRQTFLVAALVFGSLNLRAEGGFPRIRIGGVTAGMSYTSGPGWYGPGVYGPGWYGPGWYRPWWGLYDPFWSSPFLHRGLYQGFVQGPERGQVKLKAPKDAAVYIDDGFAGSAEKLKSMWLDPGIYDLEIVSSEGSYRKKIYILSGKTLNIHAELKP